MFTILPNLRALRAGSSQLEQQELKRRFRTSRSCAAPLQVGWANIELLSDNRELEKAAFELLRATTELTGADVSTEDHDKYIEALSRFEVLASEEVAAPAVSPTLIQAGGLLIAALLLGGVVWGTSARSTQGELASASLGADAKEKSHSS